MCGSYGFGHEGSGRLCKPDLAGVELYNPTHAGSPSRCCRSGRPDLSASLLGAHARARRAGAEYSAVVVGVTDSMAAATAVECAARVAGRDATLILALATGKLRTGEGLGRPLCDGSASDALGGEFYLATRAQQAEAVLRDLRERARRLGVRNVLTCYREGNPAYVLAEVATEHESRSIVIGQSTKFPNRLARKLSSLVDAELLIARAGGDWVRYGAQSRARIGGLMRSRRRMNDRATRRPVLAADCAT